MSDGDGGRVWGDITRAERPRYQPGVMARRRAAGKRPAATGTDAASVVQAAAKAAAFVQVQRARSAKRPAGVGVQNMRDPAKRSPGGQVVSTKCAAMLRSGARCRCAAMRGARRCRHHGGYEQAPDGAAAGRAYLEGRLPLGRLRRWKDHPSAVRDPELAAWVRLAGQRRKPRKGRKGGSQGC